MPLTPEEVSQVQLGGGSVLDTDAVRVFSALDAQRLRHHETLTVIVVGTNEG